jgi:hypothetical protein
MKNTLPEFYIADNQGAFYAFYTFLKSKPLEKR